MTESLSTNKSFLLFEIFALSLQAPGEVLQKLARHDVNIRKRNMQLHPPDVVTSIGVISATARPQFFALTVLTTLAIDNQVHLLTQLAQSLQTTGKLRQNHNKRKKYAHSF